MKVILDLREVNTESSCISPSPTNFPIRSYLTMVYLLKLYSIIGVILSLDNGIFGSHNSFLESLFSVSGSNPRCNAHYTYKNIGFIFLKRDTPVLEFMFRVYNSVAVL